MPSRAIPVSIDRPDPNMRRYAACLRALSTHLPSVGCPCAGGASAGRRSRAARIVSLSRDRPSCTRFSNSTRMIGLNASYSSMNVTRVRPSPRSVEARPAGRARPQRLADRVVAPRLVRLHLGEPLPRLADASGEQPLRHREVAVADESVPVVVARVQDLDARLHVLRLRTVRAAVPEDLPHVFRRRTQLDRELVALQRTFSASRGA